MKKQTDDNSGALSRLLSRPLGDLLSSIEADASFFLYLDPEHCQVRFLGINSGRADPKAAQTISRHLDGVLLPDSRTNRDVHGFLFDLVARFARTLGLTEAQMQGAAVHWLESRGLALGSTTVTGEGEHRSVVHWACAEEGRPLIRFQDALDWAASYRSQLALMSEARGDINDYEEVSDTVLKVPMSAARSNLVTDQNLPIFLAEHIISSSQGAPTKKRGKRGADEDGTLTFYFLPIRGLGQWRAAVDWIERNPQQPLGKGRSRIYRDIKSQASRLARASLEELFTLSLVNSFAASMRDALINVTGAGRISRDELLYGAFARLWWANRICFYKGGQPVRYLERGEQGLSPVETSLSPPVGGAFDSDNTREIEFFSHVGERHPTVTAIRLDLRALLGEASLRAILDEHWAFDEVRYECYLFDADDKEMRRGVEQLAQQIVDVAEGQSLKRRVINSERAEVYEGCAHWLKGSIKITGWRDSLQSLRGIPPRLAAQITPLRKIENTLALFTVLEGAAGLLRLNGILDRGNYDKLAHWFSEDPLAQWDADATLHAYHDSLVHLTRAVSSAMGRPSVEVIMNGSSAKYDGSEGFSLKKVRFPPLSKRTSDEPIFALLPGVIEPLVNTVAYLNDQQVAADQPVKLVIEDNRTAAPSDEPPHILVKIGNASAARHEAKDPSGVRTTRKLVRRTGLATIKRQEYDGGHTFTPVLLHPLELYRRIKEKS